MRNERNRKYSHTTNLSTWLPAVPERIFSRETQVYYLYLLVRSLEHLLYCSKLNILNKLLLIFNVFKILDLLRIAEDTVPRNAGWQAPLLRETQTAVPVNTKAVTPQYF